MGRVVIIAGETSGDRLGASLIRAAKQTHPDVVFEGVTGPLMREAGCATWFDYQDLAVMGFFEVLGHLPRLLRRKREIERRLLADPPDALVGIDAPDFNLRVERVAKRHGIPTVHYVCPTVWAWRQGRVHGLGRSADHVLCLFPFEAEFLAEHAIDATFVGHPLADELASPPDRDELRARLGLRAGTVVGLMPGSRDAEVARIGPAFLRTASWLSAHVRDLQFVAPMATPRLAERFRALAAELAPDCDIVLLEGDSKSAIVASDAMLVASGTATVETMLLRRPMVVAYILAPLTYFVARLLRVVKSDHIAMPNLLAGRRMVTELIQHEANPQALGRELLALLESPERREELAAAFAEQHERLRRGAGERAAAAVLRVAGLADPKNDRQT